MSKRSTNKRATTKSEHSSPTVHAARLKKLRAVLRRDSLDALLITNPTDIFYLTGFSGEDSFLFVTPRELVVLSDGRFAEELEGLSVKAKVFIRRGSMKDAVAEVVGGYKPGAMGVQGEYLTLDQHGWMTSAAGKKAVRATRGLLSGLRVHKDESEVRTLRKAIRIQEAALEAFLDQVYPGQSELDAAALLEYEMKARGATGTSFDTIMAARANGSKPHYRPDKTKLSANKALLIDWGARFGGYAGDMTRTFAFGRWPKPLDAVFRVVLEAHLAGIAAVKPGASGKEVDAAARRVIQDAGYGAQFTHSLGHGLGLDVHEGPRLASTSDDVLEPGMVVTIEPGVYLPGIGGVRIEDDVLVTERGRRNLSSLPKDLEWATR